MAMPSPFPSVLEAQAQLFRGRQGGRHPHAGRKALSQNGSSVPISLPPLPTPVPLVPRPRAVSSSQRWGWRVGQEGEGKTGCFLPPFLLRGLRAGSSGAVAPTADRSALSFLPAGGRGGAGWGAGSDPPSFYSPALGPLGLGVPLNPARPSRSAQFQKREEHWESRHPPPLHKTLDESPVSTLSLPPSSPHLSRPPIAPPHPPSP